VTLTLNKSVDSLRS